MAALPNTVPAATRLPPAPSLPWIESPAFDLVFLVLAPLTTLPLALGALRSNAFALLGFVLAFSHYASSFTFYAWDENRAAHRQRWVAFFLGPLLIAVTFLLLVTARVPLVVQVVLFFWNAVHVARQGCGLASLYRHRAGVRDPGARDATNGAILWTSLWLCLWNVETHAEVQPVLSAVSPRFGAMLVWAFGILALGMNARALASFRRRAREGDGPRLPELGIVLTGVTFFHPYLWVADSGGATFVMLLPHYVQYLGLVWLLHRRKFREPREASPAQAWLAWLAASNLRVVAAVATVGLGTFVLKEAVKRAGHPASFEAFYLLVAFVHFYVDGLFWAFRDPHVRRTVGPWLLQGAPAAAAR